MTEVDDQRIGILICLTSLDDDMGDQSALRLARLFGSRCRALLIEDQKTTSPQGAGTPNNQWAMRRRRRLTFLAQKLGLSVEFDVSALSPGLQDLRTQPVMGTTILVQPAHPLSRQTHTFRSLQDAAFQAPAATIYSPPINTLGDGEILAVTNMRNSASAGFAQDLAKRTAREFEIFLADGDPSPSVSSLVRGLTLRMSLDAPALIVMAHNELIAAPSDFSSLAARLDTPILVVGGR